jgi:hypothetical protein
VHIHNKNNSFLSNILLSAVVNYFISVKKIL